VAKLADALDLGSSAARRVGSTPSIRTIGPNLGPIFYNDMTELRAKLVPSPPLNITIK
jgi:hypothetical protein